MIRPASRVPSTATPPETMITSDPMMNVHQLPAIVTEALTHDE